MPVSTDVNSNRLELEEVQFPFLALSKITFTSCTSVSEEFETISFCFPGISFESLRILSFHNKTALLLINRCLVLRTAFPGRDSGSILDCFPLPLPAQVADAVVDVQFCRGLLFILSTLRWICILGRKLVD